MACLMHQLTSLGMALIYKLTFGTIKVYHKPAALTLVRRNVFKDSTLWPCVYVLCLLIGVYSNPPSNGSFKSLMKNRLIISNGLGLESLELKTKGSFCYDNLALKFTCIFVLQLFQHGRVFHRESRCLFSYPLCVSSLSCTHSWTSPQ